MTNPVGIPGDRICSFIERVERIDEEIKALNEGKKEVSQRLRRGLRRESPRGKSCAYASRTRTTATNGIPARHLSQGHGKRQLVASKGGVAPKPATNCRLLNGELFSPRPSIRPSMNSSIRKPSPARSHSSSFTSVAGPKRCEPQSRWPSSGPPGPPAACRA